MQYLGSDMWRIWLTDGSFIDMLTADLDALQKVTAEKVEEMEGEILDLGYTNNKMVEECDDFIDNICGIFDDPEKDAEKFSEEINRFKALLEQFRPK